MRDLKQCLMDLLRSGGLTVGDNNNPNTTTQVMPTSKMSHKPKKLHEYTAADCNAAFLRKYYEVGNSSGGSVFNPPTSNNANVIYFNENLTMTSKYDMRQFPLNRYPSCPLSTFSNSDDSVSPASSKSDNHNSTDETESCRYDYSSEEDQTTLIDYCTHNNHDNVERMMPSYNCCAIDGDVDDDEDDAEALLDSFCTLCTSSFSYNKCCRYCDNSQCGSKCNSERSSHISRHSQLLNTIQRNKGNLR